MLFGKALDYSLIDTASKESLKRSALVVAGYDIKKATEIYEYFAKDMPNLPDVTPVTPTAMEQMRDAAIGLFNWSRENQDQLLGIVGMVRNAIKSAPVQTIVSAADGFKEVV